MIGILDVAAVLTEATPGWLSLPKVSRCPSASQQRSQSAAAAYAQAAYRLLAPEEKPAAMICIAGPTGMTVDAFDRAYLGAADDRLVGPGYGTRRYRKVHPLLLLRSLQNQVAASLSLENQLTGPCLNALESPSALAYLLPNIELMLHRYDSVLLVLAAAGHRLEEARKTTAVYEIGNGLEGALCFLLGAGRALGWIQAKPFRKGEAPRLESGQLAYDAPVLGSGLCLLQALADQQPDAHIVRHDADRREVGFFWRSA